MNETERFENLQTAIKLNPNNFQARRELIMQCLDFGFEDTALFHIKYLLKVFPSDADLYFNLGICYEKLKNYKLALNAYEKAVELKPQEPDFLYNLALVYETLGDSTAAMENFKKVIFYKNEDANAFFSIGVLYSKENNSDMAIKCYKKAIEYNYSDYFAHFNLANEYKKTKQYDFALLEYRKVLELSPDYAWAYFNIAQIYWELNRSDDAILMLKKTIEKNTKDWEAIKLLIQILISKNKINEAQKILNALEKNSKNGDVYYLLSRIFELKSDNKARVDYLALALENKNTLTFDLSSVNQEYLRLKNK